MGSRYTTQSISGFNSNPPSDDGAQTASNQLQWSKHLNKIGTPLKNLAESINTALVSDLNYACRLLTASDSAAATDHKRTLQIGSTITAAITVTLADAATMTTNYVVHVSNQSAVACTIGRATASNTINGVTSNVTIYPLQTVTFIVNAAASGYNAWTMLAPGSEGQWTAFDLTGTGALLTAGNGLFQQVIKPCVITEVYACCVTGTSTGDVTIDIHGDGTTILGNKITIEATETDSFDATTQPTIATTSFASPWVMRIDCDDDGDGSMTGPVVVCMKVIWK